MRWSPCLGLHRSAWLSPGAGSDRVRGPGSSCHASSAGCPAHPPGGRPPWRGRPGRPPRRRGRLGVGGGARKPLVGNLAEMMEWTPPATHGASTCQSRLASTRVRVDGGALMHGTTIAVDVANSVFEVGLSEHLGQVRERRRLTRSSSMRPRSAAAGTFSPRRALG